MISAKPSLVQLALRKPWYAFWRLVERRLYRDRSYTLQIPFGQRIFTPWFAAPEVGEFASALAATRHSGPLIVSPDRCYMLYQFCTRAARLWPAMAMAECGVYNGGTAHLLSRVLASDGFFQGEVHLFDTFAGMPETSQPERDYHQPGDFSDTSLLKVQHRLKEFPFCTFHVGFMPDTFAEVATIEQYAFVHVDVDIYPSVLACCNWFWPRLCPGGVMVFDDYGFYPYRHAARIAVDEFFSGCTDQPIILPTGQAIVIRSGRD